MRTTTFRISGPHFEQLHKHLFPGDGDEHGAAVLAGVVDSRHGTRFLVRHVLLARDGIDYVAGTRGYRALTPDFVAQASNRAARERLCYFAVHCHGGRDAVGFSSTDLSSHQRGYPALLDITKGGPVGALVFAENAVAGRVWTTREIRALDHLCVVGVNSRRLYPESQRLDGLCEEAYARQSLMFGAVGQKQLANLRVGIIGLGGVGSLVNEYVARLGVGTIVALDFDRVDPTNLSRVVGARSWDSGGWLRRSRFNKLRKLGERRRSLKVQVAARVAREANPMVKFHGSAGNVTELATAQALRDSDFLFLCADTMQSRLVFNALVHQYLIPGVQIGSKVPVDRVTGELGNVFSVARLVLPFSGGGCLLCNELIPPDRLQEEALSPEEREGQRYVDDARVEAPSVITLNALGASQATNDFLFHVLGLFDENAAMVGYRMHYPRERVWRSVGCRADMECLHCSTTPNAVLARGDRAVLPCKQSSCLHER
jgi:molybdopterin/thiamine biosynthesis adenylyltransferase